MAGFPLGCKVQGACVSSASTALGPVTSQTRREGTSRSSGGVVWGIAGTFRLRLNLLLLLAQ